MKSPASDDNEAPRASAEASKTLRDRVRAAIPTNAFIKENPIAPADAYRLDDITDRIMAIFGALPNYAEAEARMQAILDSQPQPRTVNETEDVLLSDLAPPLRSVTVTVAELTVERSRLPYCRAWKKNGDQCDYRATFLMDEHSVCGLHVGKRDTLFIPDRLRRR